MESAVRMALPSVESVIRAGRVCLKPRVGESRILGSHGCLKLRFSRSSFRSVVFSQWSDGVRVRPKSKWSNVRTHAAGNRPRQIAEIGRGDRKDSVRRLRGCPAGCFQLAIGGGQQGVDAGIEIAIFRVSGAGLEAWFGFGGRLEFCSAAMAADLETKHFNGDKEDSTARGACSREPDRSCHI